MRRVRIDRDSRELKLHLRKRVLAGLVVLASVFAASAAAQDQPGMRCDNAASAPVATERRVVVSIPDRALAVVENGRVVLKFHVSVGAPESPSPAGEYRVINRVANPVYYHPGEVIPAGPDNPVGPRWIGLNIKGYGIHGTNEPRLIGRDVSHGCIRLRNRDVKKLFARVHIGDVVELRATRDAETADLFGANLPRALLAAATEPKAEMSAQTNSR
ncbi:MAG TPA: L,D-transpeptidase [Candidatus Acidoferrales bacterium]|nr:L,D-transpeptidase [Candidatus Acidoferrales bacterium]